MIEFKDKSLIIGSWVNSISSVVAEIMSASGFDFLCVDAEHSSVDIFHAQQIFQAIQAGNPNCIPLVRLPGNQYSETKKYLDAGAQGVIVPLINTSDEAREVIRSVKYPPWGERGVGFGRSHGYGFNFDDYMAKANDMTFVCLQIEHIKGVENIDDILSVEGIDAVFIGPYDLSASMNLTAQFDHPQYQEATAKILRACKKHNVRAGIHVVQPNPAEVSARISEGFDLIAYSLDITMIGTMCHRGLDEIKKGLD